MFPEVRSPRPPYETLITAVDVSSIDGMSDFLETPISPMGKMVMGEMGVSKDVRLSPSLP